MNKRLSLALSLMENKNFARILDAGYGGGIFLPELSRRCSQLYGIDIHSNHKRVQEMLKKEGITADLKQNDLTKIEFPDDYFDAVVCVSVLEFVSDLKKAFSEIKRITRKEGTAIIGFPIEQWFFRYIYLMMGVDSKKAHKATYREIIKEAGSNFVLERIVKFPYFLPLECSLFATLKLIKK